MNKEIKKIEKEIKTLRDHCKKEFEVAIQKLLNFKKCCKMHIFLVTICNTFECENVFQILYLQIFDENEFGAIFEKYEQLPCNILDKIISLFCHWSFSRNLNWTRSYYK